MAVYGAKLPPCSSISCPAYSSKLNDVQMPGLRINGLMWVILNSLSNRAGSGSFPHVIITSSFWGLCSFHQMLNKFKYCMSVLLLQEVGAYAHTRAHTLSLKPFFVKRLFGGVLSPACFMFESDTKRNWLQRRINSTQSPKKGLSHLIILLKWRWMHFSLSDHKASVAFGWAGLLARSPPLWCVLINTTLIVPWCYFEAWKWAFFSIVSAGAIPVGNIPVLQTKSTLWLALAMSDKTRHF